MLAAIGDADEDRLPLPAEQPDGHVERARRGRSVLRRGARARADGRRPGVLRVRRRPRLSRCDRGVPEGRAERRRPADVLEDLRPGRAPRRLRRRPGRRDRGDREGAARVRPDVDQRRRPRSRASATTTRSGAGAQRISTRWASSPACSARTASSRSRAPSATSSTQRWRRCGALRRAAPARSDRAAARRLRGAGRRPDHRRVTPEDHAVLATALSAVVGGRAHG